MQASTASGVAADAGAAALTASRGGSRVPTRRRLRGAAVVLAWLVVGAGWAMVLRPQFLGGPAAYVAVAGDSMEPGLSTGDLVVALRRDGYRRGDVVVYRVPAGEPGAGTMVIHRIVGGSAADGFVLRGDNRGTDDLWRPLTDDIAGKLAVTLPRGAAVLQRARTPAGMGLLAGLVTASMIVAGRRRDDTV